MEELSHRLVAALVDAGVPHNLAMAAVKRGDVEVNSDTQSSSNASPTLRVMDAVTAELTDVVADLQRQLQDAQDNVRRLSAERTGLADAVRRRDEELLRLSSQQLLPPSSSAQNTHLLADPGSARVIQQLHDQVCCMCTLTTRLHSSFLLRRQGNSC